MSCSPWIAFRHVFASRHKSFQRAPGSRGNPAPAWLTGDLGNDREAILHLHDLQRKRRVPCYSHRAAPPSDPAGSDATNQPCSELLNTGACKTPAERSLPWQKAEQATSAKNHRAGVPECD
jgi:hypothetical protein